MSSTRDVDGLLLASLVGTLGLMVAVVLVGSVLERYALLSLGVTAAVVVLGSALERYA